jgi:hypothetical protein
MKKYDMIFCIVIILCFIVSCQDQTTPEEPGITEDSVASTDGVSIHYQVQGEGTPALVFVPDSDPTLVEKIVADMSSVPLEVGMGAFDGNFNYWLNDIVQVVKETKTPITCINSDKYPSNLEGNKKYNPSYKLKIMTGVGHFVMLEDPENFNCLLEETVQEFVLTPTQTANHKDVSSQGLLKLFDVYDPQEAFPKP